MKKWLSIIPLSCLLAATACQPGSGCQELDVYNGTVGVTAEDASTGALIPNTTMTLFVSPTDTLTQSVGSDVSQYPVQFIGIGVGSYELAITAPGYSSWSKKVSVQCAIPPASVTAKLAKSP